MKITCERCSAQYDLDDKRIPPSGMTMKCPACLHTFVVRKEGAASGPPKMPAPPPKMPAPPKAAAPAPPSRREIPLSSYGAEEGPTLLPPPSPGMVAPDDPDGIDLPAPKDFFALDYGKGGRESQPRFEQGSTRNDSALSIGLDMEGPVLEEIDLPAPVDASRKQEVIDLPAPKSAPPASKSAPPAPKSTPAASKSAPPASKSTPAAAPPRAIELADADIDLSDLPAPKGRRPQLGISIDAPDIDDLPTHTDGPPGLELDSLDLVAPKEALPDLPAPRAESLDLAPKGHGELPDLELEPVAAATDLSPRGPSAARPAPLQPGVVPPLPVAAKPGKAAKVAKAKQPKLPPKPREGRRRLPILAAVGGVVVLIGGVAAALGVFTDLGQRLLSGAVGGGHSEGQLMTARKQMADDTLGAYRKAAQTLQGIVDSEPKAVDAAALAAQARLGAARMGAPGELQKADALLARLELDPRAAELSDVQKARALRAVVSGNAADARAKLAAVLQKAPADAAALTYLGWTELAAGDVAAADQAFGKALAAEATRAQALYGAGLARERLGDAAAARGLHQRALGRSPQHFGAAVGLARTGKPPAEALAEVEQLIKERAAQAAPRELGDAWATVGLLAAQEGRRDEAEDRLKRALALDPELASARVALARVQCDLGRCGEQIAALTKLAAAQPKNVEARLALGRAQVTTNAIPEAAATLGAAATLAPKSPEVLYWQARLMTAQPKPDREGALAQLKEAIAADPKMIPAYVAQSTTLGSMGREDEALAALQAADKQATDDPELMTALGQAYLTLGKPAEAESRFRAALEKTPAAHATRMQLGAALEAESKLDDARAQYAEVRAKDAKYPGVTERLARLAARQGKKAEAAQRFDEALKEGVPPQALRLAAATLFLDPAVHRREDARKLAEQVLTEDDRAAPAHLVLARVQLETGHPDEALPEARRAAMLADLPEAHLVLGRALEGLGKLDQAISEYQLARRPPVEADASLGRARILVRMGATKDALAELTTLSKDPKLRAPALLLMGDCYSDLQQPDRARRAYEDASRADPTSGDAAFKLGRALRDAGRRRDSIVQLERALKLGGEAGASWSAEANLLLGDAHREGHENEAAVRAYKRYLELAPSGAPERVEVQKHIAILGGS